VFSVTDKGVVSCFDAETGKFVWQHRIGGKHVASPVFAGGRLYFLAEADGETVVIEPGAEYKELARNSVGELCKGSIAASQGNLFIRSDKHLFCIGPKPE
jgi:outer membrane protein assembly factor BamB